jgi:K+-sensing histidine kinase KdpD
MLEAHEKRTGAVYDDRMNADHTGEPAHTSTPSGGRFPRHSAVACYGIAIAVVLIAFGLRFIYFGTLDKRFPFIFFVPAAMIAAWYGGLGPGLFATAAGLMLGDYFFLSEHTALGAVRDSERLAIGLYAVTTSLCVLLFEHLHGVIRRLEHAFDRARHLHQKAGQPEQAASASPPAA